MIDPIRRLLTEAGRAKQARAFWQASAEVLSDWAGGAHVQLVYKGLSESGTAEAGSTAQPDEPCIADYHDAEGRHVQATFRGDRKSTRLNSSHVRSSYAVFCLQKKT